MTSAPAVALDEHPLTHWTGPLGLPDFSRIADGDFGPVFDAALKAHEAEIEAIAGAHPDATFVEMGPGSVLVGLVKKIAPGVKTMTCGTAAEVNQLLELAA